MSIQAKLVWRSPVAQHVDRIVVREAALHADGRWMNAVKTLTEKPSSADALAQAQAPAPAEVSLLAAPWCQPVALPDISLNDSDFRLRTAPIAGRFYPRMAFASLAQSARDLRPVRVLQSGEAGLLVDPNHPISDPAAQLVFSVSQLEPAPSIRLAELFDGPGLQVPPAHAEKVYFDLPQLARTDETVDADFYAQPRFVSHLDAACRAQIQSLYGRFLQPGMRVLDLMSSWESHLPEDSGELFVAGLGMNEAELAANPRLNEVVVKDINQRTGLPWGEAQFDRVICTASVEYLLQPAAVMREIRRVLRPGGICLITFSDRWFPTKAIHVWSELHPFERQALVLSLFQLAGFTDLHTESLRGLARPDDDKYIDQRASADPLFAVWGTA